MKNAFFLAISIVRNGKVLKYFTIFSSLEPEKPLINVPKNGKVFPVSVTTPAILNVGDNITGLTNNTIQLKCPVSGIPKPKITWSRNGKEILTGGRYNIDGSGTLIVVQLNKEDAGLFSCHAHNRFGKDSRTTKVDVAGKYRILIGFTMKT